MDEEEYKIGVLHSLTGVMSDSEKPLIDAVTLAVEEINQAGGVLGRKLGLEVYDGASTFEGFIDGANHLLSEGIGHIFGCWTSFSRKAIKPIIEKKGALLWYPVQYEGLEASQNIIYTGLCLNQQVSPAIQWCFDQDHKSYFLLGSDYVYPRTANKLIRHQIHKHGCQVLGEEYCSLDEDDFTQVIAAIQELKPNIIINTLSGKSNRFFFQAMYQAGLRSGEHPVMSFSLGEVEIQSFQKEASGHYAGWSFFDSLKTPEALKFISDFHARFGEKRPISAPMAMAYSQIYLWKQSVESAGSIEVEQVREKAIGQSFESPAGNLTIQPNQHVMKDLFIGKAQDDGHFEIVWSSAKPIEPLPWLGIDSPQTENATLITELLSEVSSGAQNSWLANQEIEKRKKAEAKLAFHQKAYRDAQRLANIGHWQLDLQQNVLEWSDEVYRIFEIDKEQFGASYEAFLETIHPEDREAVSEAYSNSLKDQQPYEITHRLQFNDARIKYVREACETEFDSAGNPVFSLGTVQDITREVVIQQELEKAKKKADLANQAKSNFLSMMSHELRTPMNGVLGMAQLLQMSELTEEQDEFCRIITSSGQSLINILSDILDLSKIEAGQQVVSNKPFSIQQVVAGVTDLFLGSATTKKLGINYVIHPSVHDIVLGDLELLKRVLTNLIGNAVKFTNSGQIITSVNLLENKATAQVIQFKVKDTGIGIPKSKQSIIFDAFRQVDEADHRQFGGTGLGLAIVKDIIDLLGGSISIESSETEGSCFTFELPYAHYSKSLFAEEGTTTEKTETKKYPKRKVLLVEDDQTNQIVIQAMFTHLNMDCEIANDGQEATLMARQTKYDLIAMDVLMPVMDGYQATQNIRSEGQNQATPIVALTAMASRADEQQCYDVGMDDYLTKPIDFTLLKKMVLKVCPPSKPA